MTGSGWLSASLPAADAAPALQAQVLRQGLAARDWDCLASLCAVPNLDPAVEVRLATVSAVAVRAAWVSRLTRTGDELAAAAADRRVRVQAAAAGHPNLRADTARMLLTAGRRDVVSALLRNTALPAPVRRQAAAQLAADPGRGVPSALRESLAEEPALAAAALEAAGTLLVAVSAAESCVPTGAGWRRLADLVEDTLDGLAGSDPRSTFSSVLLLTAAANVIRCGLSDAHEVNEHVMAALRDAARQPALLRALGPDLLTLAASLAVPRLGTVQGLAFGLASLPAGADVDAQVRAVVGQRHSSPMLLRAAAVHPGVSADTFGLLVSEMWPTSSAVLDVLSSPAMSPRKVAVAVLEFPWMSLDRFLGGRSDARDCLAALVDMSRFRLHPRLFDSGLLDADLVRCLPVPVLQVAPERVKRFALDVAVSELGRDAAAWDAFWALLGEYDGTLTQLLAAARTV